VKGGNFPCSWTPISFTSYTIKHVCLRTVSYFECCLLPRYSAISLKRAGFITAAVRNSPAKQFRDLLSSASTRNPRNRSYAAFVRNSDITFHRLQPMLSGRIVDAESWCGTALRLTERWNSRGFVFEISFTPRDTVPLPWSRIRAVHVL
jgi:hypothetical protein